MPLMRSMSLPGERQLQIEPGIEQAIRQRLVEDQTEGVDVLAMAVRIVLAS
jgi:hypothetical protein